MKLLTIILLYLGILTFAGCIYDPEPVPDKTAIELSLKWDKLLDGVKPADVRVVFYPRSGGAPISRNITGELIREELPADEYDILVYNQPEKNVLFRGLEQFSTTEAYLEEAPMQKSSAQPVAQQPSMLYSVGIAGNKLTQGNTLKLEVTPEPRVTALNFDIKMDGTDLGSLKSCCGDISHMNQSINLVTGRNESVAPMRLSYDAAITESGVQFTIMTFGIVPTAEPTPENPAPQGSNLNMIFATHAGEETVATIDIAKEIDKVTGDNPGSLNIDVKIEGDVTLPNVSITATVIEWDHGSGSGEIEQ